MTIMTTEATSHATTVFGQNWSRETPKADTSRDAADVGDPGHRRPEDRRLRDGHRRRVVVKMIPFCPPMISAYRLHQSPYDGLGPADDVGLGEERVEVGDDLGARPLIGPSPVWPPVEMPAITFQKYRMKIEPRVIARTPKTVMTVAAWVRFTIVEQKSPNEPSPSAVAIRTR